MTPELAARVSAAAHRDLPHANPLTIAQVAALVGDLAAHEPATALDLGCGPGTLSMALAGASSAAVLGVDVNPAFLARARAAAVTQGLDHRVTFAHAEDVDLRDRVFDAVLCVGASQAAGGPLPALRWCRRALRRGGVLLFADLTWAAPPDDGLLAALGVTRGFTWEDGGEREVLGDAGLELLGVTRASRASWDAYERAVEAGRLRFAETLDVRDAGEVRGLVARWSDLRARHGDALGFTACVAVAV